jgi:hypothetical protein
MIARFRSTDDWKTLVDETYGSEAMRLFCDLCEKAVQQQRTRTVKLAGKHCRAAIYNTLIGYEVSAARKKIFAPDMPTARYLKIFTEIGLATVQIPYNITRTMELIQDLEKAYKSLGVIIQFFSDQLFLPNSRRSYLHAVFQHLQKELSTRMNGFGRFASVSPPTGIVPREKEGGGEP